MAFAKGFNNNNSMTTGQGMGGTQGKNYSQVANLTEAQQKDLADLKAKHQKAIAPLMLDKQEKELLADKPNWTKIESLVKEKEAIESKAELQMLKNRAEIKEKFGLNFGNDFGKGHGMGQGKGFKK